VGVRRGHSTRKTKKSKKLARPRGSGGAASRKGGKPEESLSQKNKNGKKKEGPSDAGEKHDRDTTADGELTIQAGGDSCLKPAKRTNFGDRPYYGKSLPQGKCSKENSIARRGSKFKGKGKGPRKGRNNTRQTRGVQVSQGGEKSCRHGQTSKKSWKIVREKSESRSHLAERHGKSWKKEPRRSGLESKNRDPDIEKICEARRKKARRLNVSKKGLWGSLEALSRSQRKAIPLRPLS